MAAIDQLTRVFTAIVLGGGTLSVLIYQVFKHWAARWLDNRFDERLQALRHQHERELEHLKFQISALLDRATKLHQREFDILPEAWSKIVDAFWTTRQLIAPFQSYPDIDRMLAPQQEKVIASSKLDDWEKTELLQTQHKTRYYQEKIRWHRLRDAMDVSRDANRFMLKNGIFVTQDIRTEFEGINKLIWSALTEYHINLEIDEHPLKNKTLRDQLENNGDGMMAKLERSINSRLWPKGDGSLPSLTEVAAPQSAKPIETQ